MHRCSQPVPAGLSPTQSTTGKLPAGWGSMTQRIPAGNTHTCQPCAPQTAAFCSQQPTPQPEGPAGCCPLLSMLFLQKYLQNGRQGSGPFPSHPPGTTHPRTQHTARTAHPGLPLSISEGGATRRRLTRQTPWRPEQAGASAPATEAEQSQARPTRDWQTSRPPHQELNTPPHQQRGLKEGGGEKGVGEKRE